MPRVAHVLASVAVILNFFARADLDETLHGLPSFFWRRLALDDAQVVPSARSNIRRLNNSK
jgi:hypothetical protein